MEYCYKCGWVKQQCQCKKPMTNADRIRNMTDEELAEFVENVSDALASCEYCIPISYGVDGCCTGGYRNGVLNWLQEEAK